MTNRNKSHGLREISNPHVKLIQAKQKNDTTYGVTEDLFVLLVSVPQQNEPKKDYMAMKASNRNLTG